MKNKNRRLPHTIGVFTDDHGIGVYLETPTGSTVRAFMTPADCRQMAKLLNEAAAGEEPPAPPKRYRSGFRGWPLRLALVLMCGCGRVPGAPADAGRGEEPAPADAGSIPVAEPEPLEEPAPADAGSIPVAEPEPLEEPAPADAGSIPVTEPEPLEEPAPADAGSIPVAEPEPLEEPAPADAGSIPVAEPDRVPLELDAFLASLAASGYAPCDGLSRAVRGCCAAAGAGAFSCTADGCACEGTSLRYSAVSSLCTIAPAVPLRWECGP